MGLWGGRELAYYWGRGVVVAGEMHKVTILEENSRSKRVH